MVTRYVIDVKMYILYTFLWGIYSSFKKQTATAYPSEKKTLSEDFVTKTYNKYFISPQTSAKNYSELMT